MERNSGSRAVQEMEAQVASRSRIMGPPQLHVSSTEQDVTISQVIHRSGWSAGQLGVGGRVGGRRLILVRVQRRGINRDRFADPHIPTAFYAGIAAGTPGDVGG